MLVEAMSDLTTALEDNRAGIVMSAIDFAKAFNRLDHRHCLEAFAKKGASTDVIGLLASFLAGRSMTVRLNGIQSRMRTVNAGAPQGSVLGCYLFNIGVDNLEEGFQEAACTNAQEEAHSETFTRTDDFPAASTPRRVGRDSEISDSPIPKRPGQEFDILPRVANVPPWIRKPKDPEFKSTPIKTYKYVDDEVNTNKVNMKKAKLLVENGEFFKEIVDIKTQNLLHHNATAAQNKGMVISAAKTGLMLVSAATSFDARVRITLGNQTITGQDPMKLLGVTIDRDASFKSHVQKLAARFRAKTWALSKLKKKGLSEEN